MLTGLLLARTGRRQGHGSPLPCVKPDSGRALANVEIQLPMISNGRSDAFQRMFV